MVRLTKYAAAAAIALMLVSCGKSDEEKAQELYTQADELYQRGEWDSSLQKLAEIDSLYRSAVRTRRQSMHLRPQVIERQTLAKLSETDSLIAVNQWIGDSLSRNFRKVDNVLERYYVTKNAPTDVNTHPGLYGRMAPDGVLYFVAVSPGVTADQIALNGSSSKALPHDGERCDRVGSNQVMTFLESEVDQLILALGHATGGTAEISFFNAGKPTGKLTLSAADVEALGQACQTADQFRRFKLLEIEKQRLERILVVARNQIARTTPDSTQTTD